MIASGLPGCCLALALVFPAICFGQLEKPGFCRVSQADERALPGNFSRDIDEPFSDTTDASGAEERAAEREANCTVLSYDSSFEELLGSSWQIRVIGPDKAYNYAHEGATFLSGALRQKITAELLPQGSVAFSTDLQQSLEQAAPERRLTVKLLPGSKQLARFCLCFAVSRCL